MASIKRLKKDIDYLTYSVIADCFNYSFISGKNDDQVSEIVKNIIETRNDLRNRINSAAKFENKKEVKNYYTSIFRELLTKVDEAFNQLSGVVKQA